MTLAREKPTSKNVSSYFLSQVVSHPGASTIKLFTAVIYGFHYKLVFVHGKPFQPSLMCAGDAGAYPSEAPFR
jgi:hypothetical protein